VEKKEEKGRFCYMIKCIVALIIGFILNYAIMKYVVTKYPIEFK
jgi:hypothetical protein